MALDPGQRLRFVDGCVAVEEFVVRVVRALAVRPDVLLDESLPRYAIAVVVPRCESACPAQCVPGMVIG